MRNINKALKSTILLVLSLTLLLTLSSCGWLNAFIIRRKLDSPENRNHLLNFRRSNLSEIVGKVFCHVLLHQITADALDCP